MDLDEPMITGTVYTVADKSSSSTDVATTAAAAIASTSTALAPTPTGVVATTTTRNEEILINVYSTGAPEVPIWRHVIPVTSGGPRVNSHQILNQFDKIQFDMANG